MKLKVKNLTCEDGQNLQGAIEHFSKLLLAQGMRKFGERTMSDFDISYYGKIMLSLVTMREHMELEEENAKSYDAHR